MQFLYKWLLCFVCILNCTSVFAATANERSPSEHSADTIPAVLPGVSSPDLNDLAKKANVALDNNEWQPVRTDLDNFKNFKGNEEQSKTLEAIRNQAASEQTTPYKQSDEFHQDQQKIRRTVFHSQSNTKTATALTKEQQVENYFANSRLRFQDEKTEIKNYLLSQPTWPGTEVVKSLEQFYWNLRTTSVFKHSKLLNWKEFLEFTQPYTQGLDQDNQAIVLEKLFPVFQNFPSSETRTEFLNFTYTYTQGLAPDKQAVVLKTLLPVFQNFPSSETRTEFLNFTQPYQVLDPDTQNWMQKELLSIFLALPSEALRTEFLNFTQPYTHGLNPYKQAVVLKTLLPVFQYHTLAERAEFLEFAQPYTQGLDQNDQALVLEHLLPVFQVYHTLAERAEFLKFTQPYTQGLDQNDQAFVLEHLLPVFQTHPTLAERAEFIKFAQPYAQGLDQDNQALVLEQLLPVFQAYPTLAECAEFIKFAQPYTQGLSPDNQVFVLEKLLPVFQAYPTLAERAEFLKFTQPYARYEEPHKRAFSINRLLPLFQVLQTYTEFKVNFELFTNLNEARMQQYYSTLMPHNYSRFAVGTILSFMDRTYLRYMRSLAALGAEPNPSAARVLAVSEANWYNLLPTYFAEDRLILELQAVAGVANAHDFDAIYPGEFELLKQKVNSSGYQNQSSTQTHTIYNGQNTVNNYHTNTEVEDFLKYLDGQFLTSTSVKDNQKESTPKEIASLIKQILGLEPKASTTSGGFAPYLGSSMLYANHDSPKGDEILGMAWFLMNNIISEKFIADAEKASTEEELSIMKNGRNTHRRSVVLAILEAAELSVSNAATHCQTRLTGELLKLTCWHLENSKLRKLIAHDDSLQGNSEAEIRLRVAAAPAEASRIFASMKRSETSNVKRIWENRTPELFELYMAYYDDLYRRTPVLNAAGELQFTNYGSIDYKKDEHILERDNLGNLVSKYNSDGSFRRDAQGAEKPEIVYYQAEFTILEHEFTKRMKAEFEDQRGLVY